MENNNHVHDNVGKHRHRTVGYGVNPNDGKAYCAICGKRITSTSTSGITALAISILLLLQLLTLFGPLTVKALEFFMNPLLVLLVLFLALILDVRFGRCYCEGEELDKKRLELDKLLGGLSALSLGSMALIFSVAKYTGLDTLLTALFGFAVAVIGVGSMARSANYAEQPKLTLLFAVDNDIITVAAVFLTWENVWLAALPLLLLLAQIPAAMPKIRTICRTMIPQNTALRYPCSVRVIRSFTMSCVPSSVTFAPIRLPMRWHITTHGFTMTVAYRHLNSKACASPR